MSEKQRLYIIDGNSLLHRAWHGIPPLTTKDGTIVNAVYGFAMVLDRLMANEKPTHLVVCWDVAGGTFRDDVYEDYKGTREKKEQELYDQIDFVDEVLDAYGIPSFGIEGYEADDLIGTIAEHVRKNKKYESVIITGDLDALQLVDDSTVVSFFVKGLSKTKIYDVEAVNERYGFGPEYIVDYKALKGDSSDNIPGVKGIGDKTATELILKFGGLDSIYKALDSKKMDVKEAIQEKLRRDKDNAFMSEELATIVRDVPMEFSLRDAKISIPEWTEVLRVMRRFEFDSLVRRIEERESRSGLVEATEESHAPVDNMSKASVVIDKDGSKVGEAIKAFERSKSLAIDVRDHPQDLFGSTITAITLSDGKRSFVFVSPSANALESLNPLLESSHIVSHDLKRIIHILKPLGVNVSGAGLDLMVASYLVSVGSRKFDLDSVLTEFLAEKLPAMPSDFSKAENYELLGHLVSRFIDAEAVAEKQLKEKKMSELYGDVEHPLIQILANMEEAGIELDSKGLGKMSKVMDAELKKLTATIHKQAGREFNINSPSQLAEILFDDLELPTKGIKKTQKGYSTAAPMLEKLSKEHSIIPLIGEYRELAKLKSTYVDALPGLVASDGRIHTTYNQAVTATGRLSSQDPNLQNIPIRTELGREIRKSFVAPKGRKLVAIDYSQIELRLVAALSKDKTMVEIFNSGGDIHRATAAKVFGVEEDKVTKQQRRAAKAVNFGIIYGMGPRSLARGIDVSFQEAKEFIAKYFETFPKVRVYLDKVLEQAQEDEYAESAFGRRRYLPALSSGVQMVRASAERMAKNMPLQGTASDIMKMAMIKVDEWIKDEGFGDDVRLLLQVHDELVLEVKTDLVSKVSDQLKEIMENVASFNVPLTVEVEVGDNWKEMKSS